jgi:hypothetical protein
MAYNVHVKSMPHVNVDDVEVDYLPPVNVASLPPVDVSGLPDLTITEIGAVGPVTLDGIPDRYTVAISQLPDLNLRIKEIPSIRAHVPANFRLGFSVLGVEFAALSLCGEAQVITEPYEPTPCERCGHQRRVDRLPAGGDPEPVTAVLRVQDDDT